MGFLSTFFGILGFGIGIPLWVFGIRNGLFGIHLSKLGSYSSYSLKEPVIRPLYELDSTSLQDLLPEIPLWVKNPDHDQVDWLNKFISDMWPYLDKGICSTIRSTAQPIFEEYIGKFQIKAMEFKNLSLGTLPPAIFGLKVYETNEKELVMEPAFRWAGNPNIVLGIKLLSLQITVQLVDLQIFAAPRIALKPLVPTFPCFANIVVSLMEKNLPGMMVFPDHLQPHVDFGMKILGGDIMSIPGLYRFVQETIKKQIASLYLWPQTLEIPILDASIVGVKKPVGILHVNVVRAHKLLKMDLFRTSDPYVKLSLNGDRLPAKKTTIKRNNLNPEWNEKFKLIVKDPPTQVLQLEVYDWDKVGAHDKLGMQLVPLKQLTPYETKEFKLDLLKSSSLSEPQNQKRRGQIELELTFVPFKADSIKISDPVGGYGKKESGISRASDNEVVGGAGLLSVTIQGAEDVEGERHNNPYAMVIFRGEQKKTKVNFIF
uniref:C2 domain-containing protein n=1 Tax=Fagus sylvatica TaxID=28930 RepID=A0A2N9F2A2_FAGSY